MRWTSLNVGNKEERSMSGKTIPAMNGVSALFLLALGTTHVQAEVLPAPGTYDGNIGSYLSSRCSEEKLSDGRRRFICPNSYVIWDGRRASSSGVVNITEYSPQGQVIRSCRSKLRVQCW
jgi:hypothetical protein